MVSWLAARKFNEAITQLGMNDTKVRYNEVKRSKNYSVVEKKRKRMRETNERNTEGKCK